MKCSTGKYQYMSHDLAETALIDQHIYKGFLPHEGPQDVYECHICGYWHLTSRPASRWHPSPSIRASPESQAHEATMLSTRASW